MLRSQTRRTYGWRSSTSVLKIYIRQISRPLPPHVPISWCISTPGLLRSLKNGGTLAFITSNKFMRAAYGKKLRGFLTSTLAISQVIDFGDLPVFTATSYPAVLVGRKATAKEGHELRIADLAASVRRELTDRGLRVNPETMNRAVEGLPSILGCHGHTGYSQEFSAA